MIASSSNMMCGWFLDSDKPSDLSQARSIMLRGNVGTFHAAVHHHGGEVIECERRYECSSQCIIRFGLPQTFWRLKHVYRFVSEKFPFGEEATFEENIHI